MQKKRTQTWRAIGFLVKLVTVAQETTMNSFSAASLARLYEIGNDEQQLWKQNDSSKRQRNIIKIRDSASKIGYWQEFTRASHRKLQGVPSLLSIPISRSSSHPPQKGKQELVTKNTQKKKSKLSQLSLTKNPQIPNFFPRK